MVQNNVFVNTDEPMFTMGGGYAVAEGNDFNGKVPDVPEGTFDTAPYKCSVASLDSVRSEVPSSAGATLSF